jgi:hypothetical protein
MYRRMSSLRARFPRADRSALGTRDGSRPAPFDQARSPWQWNIATEGERDEQDSASVADYPNVVSAGSRRGRKFRPS